MSSAFVHFVDFRLARHAVLSPWLTANAGA
jgi:hypothetical protein